MLFNLDTIKTYSWLLYNKAELSPMENLLPLSIELLQNPFKPLISLALYISFYTYTHMDNLLVVNSTGSYFFLLSTH